MIPFKDEELVQSFKQGDPNAFEKLHNKRNPMVMRVARSRGLTLQEAQDVSQNVWVGAMMFEGDGFRAWLMRETHRQVAEYIRLNRSGVAMADHRLVDDGWASRLDSLIYVKTLLGGVPQTVAHLLELRFYRGMAYEEIAEQTELSRSQVGRRVRNGLAAIKSRFG